MASGQVEQSGPHSKQQTCRSHTLMLRCVGWNFHGMLSLTSALKLTVISRAAAAASTSASGLSSRARSFASTVCVHNSPRL